MVSVKPEKQSPTMKYALCLFALAVTVTACTPAVQDTPDGNFYYAGTSEGRSATDPLAEARCAGSNQTVKYVGSSADQGLRFWYRCE